MAVDRQNVAKTLNEVSYLDRDFGNTLSYGTNQSPSLIVNGSFATPSLVLPKRALRSYSDLDGVFMQRRKRWLN